MKGRRNWTVPPPGMSELEVRALPGAPAFVTLRYTASMTQWDDSNGKYVHFSKDRGLLV